LLKEEGRWGGISGGVPGITAPGSSEGKLKIGRHGSIITFGTSDQIGNSSKTINNCGTPGANFVREAGAWSS